MSIRKPIIVPAYSHVEGGASAVRVRSTKWAVLGRDRSVPHLERKFYHFLMGIFCVSAYAFVLDRAQAILLLSFVGGALVIGDVLRLRNPAVNAVALRLFGKIMRREELKSVSGNSFYILGLLTLVCFFPKPIVLLSALFLAIGDPIAAVVGTLYGRHKLIGKKSWEGAIANFVCSGAASFCFGLLYFRWSILHALCLGLIGGSVAVSAELLPAPIDDNFTLPVVSAILLSLIAFVFPL